MVFSYLQLIDGRYEDALDEDGQEYLDYAINGADRMREMIDGLLAYSCIDMQGEDFSQTDCNVIIDEVQDTLQVSIEESNAEITVDSLPTVHADENQLTQVFQNLLSNAIKYSGEEPPRIHVTAEQNQQEWVFTVQDNGIGIDPEETDEIFEVFQRLHSREEHAGTGIGLAVCERIIERHNGRIWVESEPGEGSTFSFTLPNGPVTDD